MRARAVRLLSRKYKKRQTHGACLESERSRGGARSGRKRSQRGPCERPQFLDLGSCLVKMQPAVRLGFRTCLPFASDLTAEIHKRPVCGPVHFKAAGSAPLPTPPPRAAGGRSTACSHTRPSSFQVPAAPVPWEWGDAGGQGSSLPT